MRPLYGGGGGRGNGALMESGKMRCQIFDHFTQRSYMISLDYIDFFLFFLFLLKSGYTLITLPDCVMGL